MAARRGLAATILLLALAACRSGQSPSLGSYQINEPVGLAAARIAATATSHSALGRIGLKRPALSAQSEIRDGRGKVTITVPGGAGARDVVLTYTLVPNDDGRSTMAGLTMDAPDLGELDLGTDRFAGRKTLRSEFGEALGTIANRVNRPGEPVNQGDPFVRLFDLAAVLDDPALLARVKARGQQEGAVDFLFAHPPQPRGDED